MKLLLLIVLISNSVLAQTSANISIEKDDGIDSCKAESLRANAVGFAGCTPVSYSWTGPGGFTSTMQVITIPIPATPHTYSVTISGGTGSCAPASATYTASALTAAPSATLSSACAPSTITFASGASGGIPPYHYSWSGPLSFSSTLSSPVITGATASASGTYTLTIKDTNRCVATSTTVVTIAAPIANITGNSTVCIGNTITLSDATTGGTWSSTAGTGSATVDPTGHVTGVSAGTVTISYTVGGCIASKIITVLVGPAPITGTTTLCAGSTTTLSDATSGGVWSSSPGYATINSSTGLVTAVSAGTSTITYTAGSCSTTTTFTVNALPAITPGPDMPVCTSGTLTCTPSTGYTYSWSPSTGLSCTTCASPTVTPTSVATYTVTYTVTATNPSTGCSNTGTTTVTFHPSALTVTIGEVAPFVLSGDVAYTNCGGTGSGVQLSAYPADGTSYAWTGAAGTITNPSTQQPYINPTVTSVYSVTESFNGCTGSSTVTVAVPSHCTPCDMFKESTFATVSGCTDCSTIQPFHTVTATAISPTTFTGAIKNYYLYNNATCSGTGSINNEIVFVEPSKSITIASTAQIEISNCHFFGCCTNTWTGILVSTSTSSIGQLIVDNNTLIENAVNGIELSAGATSSLIPSGYNSSTGSNSIINLNGAIFNKNTNGLFILNYTPIATPSSTILPFRVLNSVFTSRDFTAYGSGTVAAGYYPFSWPTTSLTDPNSLKYPNYLDNYTPPYNIRTYPKVSDCAGSQSASGIKLSNVGLTTSVAGGSVTNSTLGNTYYSVVIGDPTSNTEDANRNFFDQSLNGINSATANLTTYNNLFIDNYAQSGTITAGAGINASVTTGGYTEVTNGFYNQLQVLGNDASSGNRFFNCANAVKVSSLYDVVCKYSTITSNTDISGYGSGTDAGQYGYYINTYLFDNIDIENNLAYNVHNGIEVVTNSTTSNTTVERLVGDVNVNNNNLYADVAGTFPSLQCQSSTTRYMDYGIFISGPVTNTIGTGYYYLGEISAGKNILCNTFVGIKVNNFVSNVTAIINNTINEAVNTVANEHEEGIFIENTVGTNASSGCQVIGNNITGPGYNTPSITIPLGANSFPAPNIIGILSVESGSSTTPTLIQCNYISDANAAFDFDGANYTSWLDNEMMDDNYGLAISGSSGAGSMGQQGDATHPIDDFWEDDAVGVHWTGSAPTAAAQTFVFAGTSVCSSPLYVRNISIVNYPTSNHTAGSATAYNSTGTACSPGVYSLNPISTTCSVTPLPGCTHQICCPGCRMGNFETENPNTLNEYTQTYTIAPNPNDGHFQIQQQHIIDEYVAIKLLNTLGSTVYSDRIHFANGIANLQLNVLPGMYIIELINNEGERKTNKVTVE